MLFRLLVLVSAATTAINVAEAHQQSPHHSHPHLIVSNEFLAAFLVAGAFGLAVAAIRFLKSRQTKRVPRKTFRGRS